MTQAEAEPQRAILTEARLAFHSALLEQVLRVSAMGIPSNADGPNPTSVAIAVGVAQRIGAATEGARLAGQTSGSNFEALVSSFLRETFLLLGDLRPGKWDVIRPPVVGIAAFEQYEHLTALREATRRDAELGAALGRDYVIKPDVVIVRQLEDDATLNQRRPIVDADTGVHASLRASNGGRPILHASVSCKWTLRSDRAQNARTEALNLVRNRKGHMPHVVVVTGEPLPSRLASIALGTGDVDCVYHFALPELVGAVESVHQSEASALLAMMIDGKRLKDISDLPLDLAV